MSTIKPILLALTFAGVVWLAFGGLRSQPDTMLKAGASEVQTARPLQLDSPAIADYRNWSREPSHFGAFAVSDTGGSGWVSDYNEIGMAEAAALAYCGAPDCRVIARSLPVSKPEEGVLLVSRASAEAFKEYLTLPGTKAYAVHGSGAGGSWINARWVFQAKRGAIRECEFRLIDWEKPPPGISGDCQVVHVSRR